MSFAVSAVIVPSPRLRWLLAGLGASLCAAAVAVGLLLPERFVLGGAVALVPLAAALAVFHVLVRQFPTLPAGSRTDARAPFAARCLTHFGALPHPGPLMRRIDISGVGQIRMTVQQDMGLGARGGGPPGAEAAAGVPMTLLPGATVWPCCMVLRLRGEDGATWPLVLLPDAVGAGQYRALAVAVRALASSTALAPSTQKTLNLLQGANS